MWTIMLKNIGCSLLLVMHLHLFSQESNKMSQRWKTNLEKAVVSLDEFKTLLARDAIPPIDKPNFWAKEKALSALFKHEPVIVIKNKAVAKAYPLSILMYHEIVNDEIDELFITVTYCPLCNASIVFDRDLHFNDSVYRLDFGVSGMLRKSDLVMWDRQTESWWQQLSGEALVGDLNGAVLTIIPSMIISLQEFFETYPTGIVLSPPKDYVRAYGTNPYTSYDAIENIPKFFFDSPPVSIPPMARLITLVINGRQKAYPLEIIRNQKVIHDRFEEKNIVLFYSEETVSVLDQSIISDSKKIGTVTVFSSELDGKSLRFIKKGAFFEDVQTGSSWTITGQCIEGQLIGHQLNIAQYGNHFAFAVFAFNPDTTIYSLSDI